MEPKQENLLALKVMRLSRPTLYSPVSIHSDPWDIPASLLDKAAHSNKPLSPDDETISIGKALVLPQSFGIIYLGETFSCYLRVQNDSNQVARNVTVKADLQTASQRVSLTKNKSRVVSQLEPQQSIDEVLHHEVTEIGPHILVCEVVYNSDSSEPLKSSRYYRFQVLKPLDVKTKFYNAESDDVYLEAQVQNITTAPIFLEKVALEPSPLFTVMSLNEKNQSQTAKDSDVDSSVFGPVNILQPEEIRQYLFCLIAKPEARANVKLLRGTSHIGKLDLVWRTTMGDRGRLQTSQLQRMAPNYGDIRLTIEELPNPVRLQTPFTFLCKISNTSERPVELNLILETPTKLPALLWVGKSNFPLGKIEPNSSVEVPLTLVPVFPGLQTITGLRLVDVFLKRTYDYDDLAQVLIVPDS